MDQPLSPSSGNHASQSLKHLGQVLYNLSEFNRKYREWVRVQYQVNPLELDILHWINREGPKKMKEIGSHFQVKLSTLTSMIDKMERNKLVERVSSEHDRRVVYLETRRKGKEVFTIYQQNLTEIYQNLESKLDKEALASLELHLNQLVEVAEEKLEALHENMVPGANVDNKK